MTLLWTTCGRYRKDRVHHPDGAHDWNARTSDPTRPIGRYKNDYVGDVLGLAARFSPVEGKVRALCGIWANCKSFRWHLADAV
jgi:hypothetical protein